MVNCFPHRSKSRVDIWISVAQAEVSKLWHNSVQPAYVSHIGFNSSLLDVSGLSVRNVSEAQAMDVVGYRRFHI